MADCDHELNFQMKGILARLSQAENNITSQFAATSMAIQGLLSNQLTSGSVASVAHIFDGVPTGFDALQKLVSDLNPIDFKQLMNISAAGLIDGMSAELDNIGTAIENAAANAAAAAESAAVGAINSLGDIATEFAGQAADLAAAITGGVLSEITLAANTLNSAMTAAGQVVPNTVTTALNTLTSAKNTLSHLTDILPNVSGMLKSQSDAAKCKATGMVINS